jgi:AcrR family transcriptional regulator
MVATPWGDSGELREMMLRPGPGTSPEEVAKNQRRRLFAAMVASLAERGYEATRVADLVEISGVSSRSFYDLFPNKATCFAAAFEAIVDAAVDSLARAGDPEESWEEQVLRCYEMAGRKIAEQPAAARLGLIEAYAAGAEAREPLRRALAELERLTESRLEESPEHRNMPADMIRAHVGAAQEIARTRLREGRPEELAALAPELARLMLSYRPPSVPLRLSTRPRSFGPESVVAHDDAERVLRAFAIVVAERGYAGATIHEVAKRGAMSPGTFYANFRDKEEALLGAIDSVGAQLVMATTTAFQRRADWPSRVRAAIGSMLNFLASRPAMAHLLAVEAFAGGPRALAHRGRALAPLFVLLVDGYTGNPEVPAVAGEAIAGGIGALIYQRILDEGPESLPALAPVCTYIALAPFIGAEAATEAANRQPRRSPEAAAGPQAVQPTKWAALAILALRPASNDELGKELDTSAADIGDFMVELQTEGLVERIAPEPGDPFKWRYRPLYRQFEIEDWAKLSQEERDVMSRDTLDLLNGEATQALAEGTFNRRLDMHLSRLGFIVDEQGWQELADIHRAALDAGREVLLRSQKRLRASGEKGVEGRSVQMLFEMPGE